MLGHELELFGQGETEWACWLSGPGSSVWGAGAGVRVGAVGRGAPFCVGRPRGTWHVLLNLYLHVSETPSHASQVGTGVFLHRRDSIVGVSGGQPLWISCLLQMTVISANQRPSLKLLRKNSVGSLSLWPSMSIRWARRTAGTTASYVIHNNFAGHPPTLHINILYICI